jgi:hypothetical protein
MTATVGPAIYPGTDTFPGTDVYPGQGNFPHLWALISYSDAADTSPVWTDVTDKVKSFSIRRGRSSELEEVDAGTCQLVLDNRDRDFDPTVSSIRPLSRVWLQEQFSGETQSLFYGYVEAVDNQWPDGGVGDAVAELSCVDEFKVLALDKLPTMNPPRDTYSDLVASDQPSGHWRFSNVGLEGEPGTTWSASGSATIENTSPILGDSVGGYVLGAGGSISLASTA